VWSPRWEASASVRVGGPDVKYVNATGDSGPPQDHTGNANTHDSPRKKSRSQTGESATACTGAGVARRVGATGLGDGKAIRYGIGVGRDGFTWSGTQSVTRKAEWPDWTPPQEMIARQPYLPRWMAGGSGNPLGARAIYLGSTIYRIHGTNMPSTIGHKVSSGCIRMLNADVIDLYSRVGVGTKVVVLANRT
jgi:lipoprotein-anchoring transpeptidase ErfK/SrfK